MSQRPPSSSSPDPVNTSEESTPPVPEAPSSVERDNGAGTLPADASTTDSRLAEPKPTDAPPADATPGSPDTAPAGSSDAAAAGPQESTGGIAADGGFAAGPAGRGGTATAASPATGLPDDHAKHRGKAKGPLSFFRELPALVIIAFLLALLIKSFLVQAFYIPSESMVPTLKVGDRVLVNKLAYKFNPPHLGDVIVFADPNPGAATHRGVISGFFHWVTEGLGFSAPENEDFIKRVIGLPGDTVEERHGVIYLNGHRLIEPYLNQALPDDKTLGPYKVLPNHLFVLGDNRADSNDSRFSELGQIPMDKVIGKAFIKIWPPGHFGGLSDGTKIVAIMIPFGIVRRRRWEKRSFAVPI
jgi:signal peptidase I